MKNVTITLDETTVRQARRLAARQNKSLSRLIAEMLAEKLQADRRYDLAMRQYFALRPRLLGAAGQPYASREELHERTRLR